jgi:hypothetical protein
MIPKGRNRFSAKAILQSYKGTGLNANARREAGHENAPHAA